MSLGGYCRAGWRCGTRLRIENTLFLAHEQLVELTHRKCPSAQMRALRSMGIEFAERPDGTPVVSREHVESRLGVKPSDREKSDKEPVIDWSLVK